MFETYSMFSSSLNSRLGMAGRWQMTYAESLYMGPLHPGL